MFRAASGASCVIAGVCAVGAKKKGVLYAALRDLKREKREEKGKREGKEREREPGNAHRRKSVQGSERSKLRHSRCVREKMGGGGVGAPQASGLTCKETLKI